MNHLAQNNDTEWDDDTHLPDLLQALGIRGKHT